MKYSAIGLRKAENGTMKAACALGIPPDVDCPEKLKEWVKTQKVVYDEVLLMSGEDYMRLFW